MPRILLVIRSPDSRESLAMLLGFLGHDVRAAETGFTALAQHQVFRPHAILIDIRLRDMSGWDLARRIRQEEKNVSSFLIAMSGSIQDQDRLRSREAGFNVHLSKPVDPRELQRFLDPISSDSALSGIH